MALIRRIENARAILLGVFQVSLGIALIAGLTILLKQVPQDEDLPSGWTIIRPPHEVSALALQQDTIWAGGKDGLVAIDRQTGSLRPGPPENPVFRYVKDLLVDAGNHLWIAHGKGVTCCAGGGCRDFSEQEGLPAGPVLSLLQVRDGSIWAGTEQGILKYNGQSWQRPAESEMIKQVPIDVLYQDRDGVLWIGSSSPTQGSLNNFDGGRWNQFSTRNGLAHRSINAILQDRQGAIWFATGFGNRGGATRLADGKWTTMTRADGLAGDKVRSVYEDRQGRLWLGSEYDGVAVWDGVRWKVLTPKDGLAGFEVKEMLQDDEGVYWLGTENGVSRIAHFSMSAAERSQAHG